MSTVIPPLADARKLLYTVISAPQILRHSEATRVKAVQIASMIAAKIRCDTRLVELGGLLHDIGRAKSHDVTHGYVGGRLLLKHQYPNDIRMIVERHVLGGFTKFEAESLGLPKRDSIPQSWEEKIVCVADKLGVYDWEGINQPQDWLNKVNKRFSRLTQRYGTTEPYKSSMERARQFTQELAFHALTIMKTK
ncbi:MAG: HDIG domain-containing metalloprotein [Promethearchaeota archaeon]